MDFWKVSGVFEKVWYRNAHYVHFIPLDFSVLYEKIRKCDCDLN